MKYAHVIPFLDFSNTSHLLSPLATHVVIGTEMQFFRLHILEVQEYREYPRFQWNANICETEMKMQVMDMMLFWYPLFLYYVLDLSRLIKIWKVDAGSTFFARRFRSLFQRAKSETGCNFTMYSNKF